MEGWGICLVGFDCFALMALVSYPLLGQCCPAIVNLSLGVPTFHWENPLNPLANTRANTPHRNSGPSPGAFPLAAPFHGVSVMGGVVVVVVYSKQLVRQGFVDTDVDIEDAVRLFHCIPEPFSSLHLRLLKEGWYYVIFRMKDLESQRIFHYLVGITKGQQKHTTGTNDLSLSACDQDFVSQLKRSLLASFI
ncbi:hypothetical protein F5Y17DRAFT_332194 [Xylariaceae sp. FL0594]|nr:hypothetical protein F5Y17DRAFT_332194 [Xylariaceae sp. FL0594]